MLLPRDKGVVTTRRGSNPYWDNKVREAQKDTETSHGTYTITTTEKMGYRDPGPWAELSRGREVKEGTCVLVFVTLHGARQKVTNANHPSCRVT